ncbi:MAG: hypothetical protein AB8B72_06165 [Crocinitomicaceae bacterium]
MKNILVPVHFTYVKKVQLEKKKTDSTKKYGNHFFYKSIIKL